MTKKILITGALGQIGSELSTSLKKIYGNDNVITSDLKTTLIAQEYLPYETLDILNRKQLFDVIKKANAFPLKDFFFGDFSNYSRRWSELYSFRLSYYSGNSI